MTNSQYYGWSREDAAPINQPAQPRRDTFLTRRLEIVRKAKAEEERGEK